MKQFEIFWSHTRNFIKKKQLFLFSFFFFIPIRKSSNTAERLDESRENSAERRDVLSGSGERTQMCRMAQWAAERLLSAGTSLFPGKYCQISSFLPQDTAHRLSLSADSLLGRPSGLGLDDTVNFSVDLSTSQGLTSSTWAAEHGTEHCCSAADLTSLYFPIWRQMYFCKLVLSQTLLSKYLHLVSDKLFPKQGCKVCTSTQIYREISIQNYATVALPYVK